MRHLAQQPDSGTYTRFLLAIVIPAATAMLAATSMIVYYCVIIHRQMRHIYPNVQTPGWRDIMRDVCCPCGRSSQPTDPERSGSSSQTLQLVTLPAGPSEAAAPPALQQPQGGQMEVDDTALVQQPLPGLPAAGSPRGEGTGAPAAAARAAR